MPRCYIFLSLALIVGLGSVGVAIGQPLQPIGFQSSDLYKLRSVGEVQFSPTGEYLAYTVQSSEGPGRPSSQVWVMNMATRKSTRLGGEKGTGSEPCWSPDGNWISYMGSDGRESGLIVAKADGTEAKLITPVRGTNHALPSMGKRAAWSPDGKKIAFVSSTPGPETEQASGDPVVITRYLYKPTASEGLTRFDDNRRLHVFVADVSTKEIRQLTDGVYYEHSLDWSPKGDEIIFVSNREPDPDRFFNYDLFAINVQNGSIRRLTATENAEYRPIWSPDGRVIVYQGTKRGLTSSETTMEDTHIWLINADGGQRRELEGAMDNRQGAPAWAPDGSAVYFPVQERGNIALYRLPLAGGKPEVIVSDRGAVRSFSMAKNGALAYVFAGPQDQAQLYLKTKGGGEKLTDLNAGLLKNKQVAEVEPFTFLSFDGMEIQAFLTKPLGIKEGSRSPLIVMIHGGPHGQQGPEFNFKAQVYASRGWASLMVNYRGSTGYGQKFTDAIFKNQNGGEARDVLCGTEAALRRYLWLDRNRVGVEGGSYGGQLTNWLITQTSLFAAAIPSASISNLVSLNYMSYYHDYLAVEFGEFPHQGNLMDLLWERSALKHVAQVKTPTMFIHGENDNDVPIAEAEQFYIALKDVGVETVMVRYPREGHGVREAKHVIDTIDRSIAWYENHFRSSR